MIKDRYIAVTWSETQDFMGHPNYYEEVFFDPEKNIWFVPEDMYNEVYKD